jgi:uncharacterized membrane protein
MRFFSSRKIYIIIIALVTIISFIFIEARNPSGFEILIGNHFLFFPVLLSIGLIITFYLVYQKRIAIEEIEEKLKEYREKRGIEFEMRERGERIGKEFRLPFGPAGLYYPTERKIVMYSSFPHPLSAYETKRVRVIKEKYPEYWKEIEELLLKAIKEPYAKKNELYSKFDELKEKIKMKLKGEEKKFKSLINLLYLTKVRFVKQIEKELEEIAQFLAASPKTKLEKISEHIFIEAHETGHAIFHSFFKEKERAFYSTRIARFFSEGFADAFTLYYIAKQVERGYLPLDVLKLAAHTRKQLLEYVINLLESGKEVGIYLNYVVGDIIFYLDKAWEEIEKLSPGELSPVEYRKKVREIRSMIGNRIEYVIGIIKSPIPFEEKYKKLEEIKIEAYKKISRILES